MMVVSLGVAVELVVPPLLLLLLPMLFFSGSDFVARLTKRLLFLCSLQFPDPELLLPLLAVDDVVLDEEEEVVEAVKLLQTGALV